MPEYMDLEVWGCDDDQGFDGKPGIEELVAQLADGAQRKVALQALSADAYAAEDLVRSVAWPDFCAAMSAVLSAPEPNTAMTAATFLGRVLEEVRLCDPQGMAEVFIALASHIAGSTGQQQWARACEPAAATEADGRQERTAHPTCGNISMPSGDGRSYREPALKARDDMHTSSATIIPVDCTATGMPSATAAAKGRALGTLPAAHSLTQTGPQHEPDAKHAAAAEAVPASLQELGDARAAELKLLVKALKALPKAWVCLKAPLKQKLWSALSSLLLVEPGYDVCQATGAAHEDGTGQDSQPCLMLDASANFQPKQSANASASGQGLPSSHMRREQDNRASAAESRQPSSIKTTHLEGTSHGRAPPVRPAAQDVRLVSMLGPLVEVSLAPSAHEASAHAKSWWQAWTIANSSTKWLPGALQEQRVLPGILTCCHALAHSGDRCRSAHAAEVLAVQILGTVLSLVHGRGLFPVSIQNGGSSIQVTAQMAMSWLISIAATSDQHLTEGHGSAAPMHARQAIEVILGSEKAVTVLLTREHALTIYRAHQDEQLQLSSNGMHNQGASGFSCLRALAHAFSRTKAGRHVSSCAGLQKLCLPL